MADIADCLSANIVVLTSRKQKYGNWTDADEVNNVPKQPLKKNILKGIIQFSNISVKT